MFDDDLFSFVFMLRTNKESLIHLFDRFTSVGTELISTQRFKPNTAFFKMRSLKWERLALAQFCKFLYFANDRKTKIQFDVFVFNQIIVINEYGRPFADDLHFYRPLLKSYRWTKLVPPALLLEYVAAFNRQATKFISNKVRTLGQFFSAVNEKLDV